MRRFILKAALFGAVTMFGVRAQAADILWGSAQGISGDSDVSTHGTLVGAFNVAGPATTINGVGFQEMDIVTGSNTVGDFTMSAPGFVFGSGSSGSASAPYASLGSAYRSMVGTAVFSTPMSLTVKGLTVGSKYEFEAWVNDSQQAPPAGTLSVDVVGGANTVTLDPNPSGPEGGLGQFVIGTFIADASTQTVDFIDSEVTTLNGFQLRLLPAVINPGGGSGVPLPVGVYAGLLGLVGAGLIGRRMKVVG